MRQKLFIITALILLSSTGIAFEKSTIKDMPFVLSSESCQDCHTREDAQSFQNNTVKSCTENCTSCHKELGSHHETDLFMSGKIPLGIELLNKKIACFTCHDLAQRRFDVESWKAESLYERMFHKKEIYPTYFLIMKNNEGQLCKRCH